MERVKTGIPGFDDLVQGGIPKGASILVSGGTGCGKSIFAMQFIYNGAKQFNEPGLYVTLETNLKNLAWDMQNFNWDIKPLQDAGLMKIYRLNLGVSGDPANIEDQIEAELEVISAMVKELGAKRIVIDSTTAFGVWIREEGKLRGTLYKFVDALKDLDCTTLLTAEVRGDKHVMSAFGVEEFVADGVVALYFTPPFRSLFVRKMRGTNHSKKIHPLDISAQGLKVNPKDEIMWDAVK
ncbi:MAG TPA: AAA family ATPase [Candidatus Diapherotrites archaeon]|uniref:AAA family ATPase n=1 Tax=Candidatus Iainarchaeum sp. TaxID=3101447 RepID=A0A7J4JJ13_9ARCH|nr:AAA family ATPase [Candidatus Diapherotrites archaeon]HIH16599.1 AAA family ATPase [Candidatus Diapherotrites archaeon]